MTAIAEPLALANADRLATVERSAVIRALTEESSSLPDHGSGIGEFPQVRSTSSIEDGPLDIEDGPLDDAGGMTPGADELTSVRAEVERIIAITDDRAYERAVNSFLSTRRAQWKRVASHLCHSNSVQRSQYLEDVEAIVIEVVWEMLQRSRREPVYLETMRSFLAIVVYNARPKVRSYLDHATAPASGMVGAQRRRRELARTRSELAAARGRVPTVAETVAKTNERLIATRKNAVRQGMVVSAADELALRGAVPFDEAMDSGIHVDVSDTFVLHPVEGPSLVKAVVQLASADSDQCGKVAAMWVGEAYSSSAAPPAQDTIAYISRQLGITRKRTVQHIERVRELAVQHLAQMGITGSATEPTA